MKLKRMGLWLTLAALPVVVGGVLASHQYVPAAGALENGAGTDESPYEIWDLEDYKAFFTGDTHVTHSAILMADIDLGGEAISGMGGGYSGTFNGNNKKVYNASIASNQSHFHIINETGVVKDFTIECSYEGGAVGAVRPMAYSNNGTMSNNTVVLKTASNVNNFAAHSYVAGTGAYENLETHFLIGSSDPIWMCPIYRDGPAAEGAIKDCTYTVTTYNNASLHNLFYGDGDITKSQGTETTDVSYILADVTSIETAVGVGVNFDYLTAGTACTSKSVTIDNTNVATCTEEEGTVTINALTAGETNLNIDYVVSDTKTVSLDIPVTISDAAAVSDVSITGVPESLEEGTQATLTAVLTGNTYDHITWTSNDDLVATVEGNGTTATVTAVGAGNTTVTVTVYDAENEVLATASSNINVIEAVTFRVHLLAPYEKTSYALGPNGWGDVAYAKMGSNYNPLSRQVGENDSPIVLVIDSDKYYVYSGDVSVSSNNWTGNGNIEVNNTTVGAWGGPATVNNDNGDGTYGDVILMSPWDNGSQESGEPFNPTLITTWTPTDLEAGLEYAAKTAYGTTAWRDETGRVCGILDESQSTRLNTVLNGYDALDDGTKAVVNCVYDTFDEEKDVIVTLGETITYLKSRSTISGATYLSDEASAMAKKQEFNATTIWLLTLLGLIPVVGVSASLIIKRRRESK